MRILFTTILGAGHFNPLVPIARAAAGHEVAFVCAASFAPTIERAGFRAFSAGFDPRGRELGELFPGWLAVPEERGDYWALPHLFAGFFAKTMVPDLLSVCRDWRPDLIVRDSIELGGCVAAEVLGIPHASVRTDAISASYAHRHLIAAPLAELRVLAGLPPDPNVRMPHRYLHLAGEPSGFVLAGEAVAPTMHRIRPGDFDPSDGTDPPPWLADGSGRPTVYATLGTFISRQPSGRAAFPAILEALRDEPINLLLTLGRTNDPEQFGPQPPHVHVARYISQGLLLPHCDLMVSQGGFSTITGALRHGVPLVIIPFGADQPYNAACCAALGVARVLGPEERTPEAIRAATRDVLHDPMYRRNAERVRDEMEALPGPEYAVELLERLAAEKRPLLTE